MGEKRSFEREAMDGRTGERTGMWKMAYLRRLRSHQLIIWRIKRDARVRWEVTNNRSAASQYEEVEAWMPTVTQLQGWIICSRVKFENLYPSLAAVASATKPWIRFLI